MAKKTRSSQEIGLELGIIWGKHLYGIQHLHYGMWDEGLKPTLENFHAAQMKYCDFLKANIPEGVKTILDVGCGTGAFLYELSKAGYQVEGVTPSIALIRSMETETGEKLQVYESLYEHFETDRKYDLILFSESYQYIDIAEGMKKSMKLLNDNGYILICDFFKKDKLSVSGQSPMSGGHKMVKFEKVIRDFPVEEVKRIDITAKMAPNIDIVDDMIRNLVIPSTDCLFKFVNQNWIYKSVYRIVTLFFRKRILNLRRKYLSGERNAESFAKYKEYLLLLYRKK